MKVNCKQCEKSYKEGKLLVCSYCNYGTKDKTVIEVECSHYKQKKGE